MEEFEHPNRHVISKAALRLLLKNGHSSVRIEMKQGKYILYTALWYLAGCAGGALVAPRYILHAIFKAPHGVLLHFQYPDILMGELGMAIVGIVLLLTGVLTAAAAANAKWALCRAGIYATGSSIGLFGGFAAVLEQVI